MKEKLHHITVIGAGTLGTQIALWSSTFGYRVCLYDINQRSFQRSMEYISVAVEQAGRKTRLSLEDWKNEAKKVAFFVEMDKALRDADLVIEAVFEDLALKRNVFAEIDMLAPSHAILATNSSSIPISRIESATGRAELCMNIHFYSLVHGQNMADLMGGAKTTAGVMETVKAWVRSVGCIPLTVKKESLGFCFNRIWRAVKREALHMWAEGVVDFRDVDRGWMTAYGTPWGPFGIMDRIGLDVVYDIEMMYYNESKDPKDFPPHALREKIKKNEIGIKTNRGFYEYPHPEYRNPEFLR
ncbi:MAG: 3-hydroxyacyl-CoA dehydrogenase family protein [Spirochaetes bacterium]|nr:3-hydroxyacyl-CoA dehydrogenase family protein [Spirochaetota bacterium]